MLHTLTSDALLELLAAPGEPAFAGELVIVDGRPSADPAQVQLAVERLATLPCVVLGRAGWADAAPPELALVDAVVDDDALAAIEGTVAGAPLAASALALYLRSGPPATVTAGLVAESALYSALQAGPEFAAWRAATPVRQRPASGGPVVRVSRDGDLLRITLDRPAVRNALDVQLRDELLDALAVAEADPALHVVLSGEGPTFCAGGDLDEFGTAPDPTTAHLVRLRRSVGAVLARLSARVTVHLHGACCGSGIELPAFAGRVVARPDTTLSLPELGLGLVPGAGGTVSLPTRIGRHRTAWLALTRRAIDASTAQRWGLIDEVRTEDTGPAARH